MTTSMQLQSDLYSNLTSRAFKVFKAVMWSWYVFSAILPLFFRNCTLLTNSQILNVIKREETAHAMPLPPSTMMAVHGFGRHYVKTVWYNRAEASLSKAIHPCSKNANAFVAIQCLQQHLPCLIKHLHFLEPTWSICCERNEIFRFSSGTESKLVDRSTITPSKAVPTFHISNR